MCVLWAKYRVFSTYVFECVSQFVCVINHQGKEDRECEGRGREREEEVEVGRDGRRKGRSE